MERLETYTPISDEDWQAASRLHNTYNFDTHMSAESMMDWAQTRPSNAFNQFKLHGDSGNLQIFTVILQAVWLAETGAASIRVYSKDLNPDLFHVGLDYVLDEAAANGFSKLTIWAFSVHPEIRAALVDKGFVPKQTNFFSEINLETASIEPVESDFEVLSFADLKQDLKDNFEQKIYDLETQVFKDVPMVGEYVPTPFETFVADLYSPEVDLNLLFAARDSDGELMGLTELLLHPTDETFLMTGVTGTLRPYRRKGVAKALKTASFIAARQRGIQRILTDNEKENPMYQINLDLGFQYRYESYCYAVELG